jgi:hypothetical protein
VAAPGLPGDAGHRVGSSPGETSALADQGTLGEAFGGGRRALPFPAQDGGYGAPEDDGAAVRDVQGLPQAGGHFLAFAWPAFWWLDYYAELHRYLRAEFRCMLENERTIVFDLRPVLNSIVAGK